MKTQLALRVAAILFATAAIPAIAATTTGTLTVEASIADACMVVGGTMNFGNFDPRLGTALDTQEDITVICTNTTPYTISLNVGGGTGATFATRVMESANDDPLNYSLYTTGARNVVWGDGTSSSATVGGTGSGEDQTITIYGRILGNQMSAPVESYADSVTITVTY